MAAAGRDDEIRQLLAAAPSQSAYAKLARALCAAVEKPAAGEIAPRVFAMPWIIVCGASADATIECVLRDAAALEHVLEREGVFGQSRNLGLSNALCAIETLEALPASRVWQWSQTPGQHDVPPAPIVLARGEETVHVRFLLGAAIAPADAPDIVETGGNVGAWGTHALRAMAAQLVTPDVQILPLPRAPAGICSAAYAGRRAGMEAALNLFMSNSVRRFRMKLGDPSLTISAHDDGEVRITLWSAFDDATTEGFRWPLHPQDDLDQIEQAITTLAQECRLAEPLIRGSVLPARTTTGAVLFPR